MTKQAHTPFTALGSKTNVYTANAADITMLVADVSNKEMVVASGNDLVVAHNTGGSPYTITVSSVVDPYGRTGDVAAYSLGAGEYAVFGPFANDGWRQTDGKLYFEASNAAVKFGVVKLP